MSYILDALKRADAERTRGAVPGLHAQPWPNAASPALAGASNRLWMLLAVAVVLISIAVTLWLWRAPAPPVSVPALVPVAAPAKPAPTTPVAKALPAAPQAAPASKANAVTQPDTVAHATGKTSAPTATATSSPAPAPVPLLSELPEATRGQIPPLTITSTVYSDNPALRLLLVNNQVLPQGSTVAAGVTLEEIRPRSSTFSFRGTRFRVAH